MTTVMTAHDVRDVGVRITDIIDSARNGRLRELDDRDRARMLASGATIDAALAAGDPVYGLTRGFGPFVEFAAGSESAQGLSLISHLGTGQGDHLDPDVCRVIVGLRLESMRRGFSAVRPEFWEQLARAFRAGFVPAIPREGTVSASGDLQPLAHAALAWSGTGEAWFREPDGRWAIRPAAEALAALDLPMMTWPVREALAFVNGTGASLGQTLVNTHEALALVRAAAALSARIADIFGANPEHFAAGTALARNQAGQAVVAGWIRDDLTHTRRDPARPLQEPYSLRCAPQVLGAVLDQLLYAGDLLVRESDGCTDNPLTVDGQVLHAGNFHAMPVGFASESVGLAVHMAVYLAERQLAMICSPTTNGGLPLLLTPRAGSGAGLAGVQISATSFVSRIRQLVTPASLTTLPTNGWNQDHVPMALNSANGVRDALRLGWLVVGSLGVGVAQMAHLTGHHTSHGPWSELAAMSPPLDEDRPLAAEVRQAKQILRSYADARSADHG